MKRIYLDSNVWNFLYEQKINLIDEFPPKEYQLFIISEQVFENKAIPDSKKELKMFIDLKMKEWNVGVDKFFGFFNQMHSQNEQRAGGFGAGRLISPEEQEFINKYWRQVGRKKRKSRLYKNEADVMLAARAMHSMVLTLDIKKGPLFYAKKKGGNVVFINEYKFKNNPSKNKRKE